MNDISRLRVLAKKTMESRNTTAIMAFLRAQSKFHKYSLNNIACILAAKPDATKVMGFHAWHSVNRYVRKGEHGIPILAPVVIKSKDENGEHSKLVNCKVVYVFDISQTDGEPLPEAPDWTDTNLYPVLQDALLQFADTHSITVKVAQLPGTIRGESTGGNITVIENAGTGTLIHELAHEILHWKPGAKIERRYAEIEAETVSWLVLDHFGFVDVTAPNYLALFDADPEAFEKVASQVLQAANQIISWVEDYYITSSVI